MKHGGLVPLLLLSACANPIEVVQLWEFSGEHICVPKVAAGAVLPRDIAFSTSRYTLPFGRYDSVMSFRPFLLTTALTATNLAEGLISAPGQQGASSNTFSPDGKTIYFNLGFEAPQHAMGEQSRGAMSIDAQFYRQDAYAYDIATGAAFNLTALNPVSLINSGVTFLDGLLAISSFINGENRPYVMNPDGTDKRPLTSAPGFTYGLSPSPDGAHYAFHANYQVYIGVTATGEETRVVTPCAFNFNPVWSPDGAHIAFSCGANHVSPDIYIAKADGSDVQFLGSRNGFGNTVAFTSAPDYHDGNSDTVAWTPDSSAVIYAAGANGSVELFVGALGVEPRQLTFSIPGSSNNFPAVSPDGTTIAYAKLRGYIANLYTIRLNGTKETQITDMDSDCGLRFPAWRP